MSFETAIFTEKDRYLLDVQGLVIQRGFLSQSQLATINSLIDESLKAASYAPYKFNFFELSSVFCEIMVSSFVCKACEIFLGEHYRFDHCMGIQFPGKVKAPDGSLADIAGNLHGGSLRCQGSVFTLDYGNRSLFGQLGLGIALTDQDSQTGGFCCVLGSHRQPAYWQSGSHVFNRVLRRSFDSDAVLVPQLAAGDAFLFPDNLVHGTTHWKDNSTKRRSLYYKYVPGFAAWRPYSEIEHYVKLAVTDKQRKLLRAPYVGSLSGDVDYADNLWKSPT